MFAKTEVSYPVAQTHPAVLKYLVEPTVIRRLFRYVLRCHAMVAAGTTKTLATRLPMNLAQKLRQRLARLIALDARGGSVAKISADRGRLLLETLEGRQMMAGDVSMWFTDPAPTAADDVSNMTDSTANDRGSSSIAAAGESPVDLVELAKHLDQEGFEFYGAAWCPACTQQKQLFQDGQEYLPFTEVTLNDATRSQDPQYADLNITEYPTWVFPDGTHHSGVQSIESLISASGFVNPEEALPTFAQIGPQTVAIGSPLHIPIDAYDADGGPLTVTVSVQNPSILSGTVLTGNRSLRLDMEGYGDMVFELFEQRAPEATGRVIELAEEGFYDGLLFHRVVDNFVIQAGDPNGDGTGGSDLGSFDDDFNAELQHNRSGVLSFAKSTDDTNNSQFFVTEVPTRFLDFQHSVFGQLVEGDDVREAISETNVNASDKPTNPVRITQATVFNDTENSVVMLKALSTPGTTNVTFTITDSSGRQYQEVVPVTVTQDVDANGAQINSQPFLKPIDDPILSSGDGPATLQLESVDVEGDAVRYYVTGTSSDDATATVDPTSGLLVVTPKAGFQGDVRVGVAVLAASISSPSSDSPMDSQVVTFTFDDSAIAVPSSIDLRATSDSGSSNTDNVTNLGSMTFDISGVTTGATVQIIDTSDNTVVGVGTATGNTIAITTNNIAAIGQGTYTLAARQVIDGTAGEASATLTLTYDTSAPTLDTSTIKTTGNVNTLYQTNLVSAEEGSGATYALTTRPSGATIVAGTGVINWTPSASQTGANPFTVTLTDKAGNVSTKSFTVDVAGEPLAGIKLEITDLNGNPVSSLDVGDKFLLKMYGTDERARANRGGIYAAYADIVFDGTLVRVVPGTSIDHPVAFSNTPSGTINTGLIDEIGGVSTSTAPSNDDQSLIATLQMETLAAGSVNFVTNPADGGNREVLLFFNNDNVPADAISYGSASLAVGQSFTANSDSFTVAEDSGPTELDVLANDTIVSGSGTLSVVSVTQPSSGGSVTLSDGIVSFTPAANFVGTAEFTYLVAGPGGVQNTVPVTVTVTGTNDPPVGVDDTFIVDTGSVANTLDVLANDLDSADPGETFTVTGVTTPTSGGTVTINADGSAVSYTPPATFVGTDTFEYTLSDGTSTDTVSVTVTVQPADAPPTAVDDSFPASGSPAINEDAPQASYDVLANDTADVDNQTFEISAVGTPSAGGTVSISADGGSLLYQPKANFHGTETVTYTIRDSGGGLATATATFNVTSVNDVPPISDGSITISKGADPTTVLSISDLPANVDIGEALKFINLTAPNSGTVAISADGQSILFTPADADFTGEVTFDFSVEDAGGLQSGPATMTITVAEYLPRSFEVLFSGSSFGFLSGNLSQFVLTGTDVQNNAVSIPLNDTSVVVTDNGVRIPNLLPGSYQLNVPAIPFLHHGETAQTIDIESGVDESDESVELSFGSIKAQYYSVADWLGSAPKLSVLAAVNPGGEAVFAYTSSAASDAVSGLQVRLDDTGDAFTINADRKAAADATDQSPVPVSLSASVNDDSVVQVRGTSGEMQFFRISLQNSKGELNFTVAGSSGSSASSANAAAATAMSSSAGTTVTDETVPQNAADLFNPSGEPLPGAEATAADDSSLQSDTQPVGEPLPTSSLSANVDAAMADVTDGLKRISPAGDQIAEAGSGAVETFSAAVDRVLTDLSDA
ncbi:Ig-like domain-containing protein [Allorhodopirellula heiligendammensis]|uniref:peptidylprolyl isomerase n=1 Tax=Allorhodopirellula heiligendammensis TaxID=2714739 RepID=A0A5C6BGR3_9BACT|nr:tandem-95 repeat protein [Allorhodopirellula heiligendammensis]TWU10459.1 putative peptidyl-prolyl cis-trans isomerase [Allorhodopirellula heiligendammensis]